MNQGRGAGPRPRENGPLLRTAFIDPDDVGLGRFRGVYHRKAFGIGFYGRYDILQFFSEKPDVVQQDIVVFIEGLQRLVRIFDAGVAIGFAFRPEPHE